MEDHSHILEPELASPRAHAHGGLQQMHVAAPAFLHLTFGCSSGMIRERATWLQLADTAIAATCAMRMGRGVSSTWHIQQLYCERWTADRCGSAIALAIPGPETAGSD